jgi:hypothetical protein
MKYLLLLPLAAAPFVTVQAQERTAGSNLDTQMTWSALSGQITTATQRADSAHIRIDQVAVCGAKGMVYSPGGGGDSQGCRDPKDTTNLTGINNSITNLGNTIGDTNSAIHTLTTKVTNIQTCSNSSQYYSSTKNTCLEKESAGVDHIDIVYTASEYNCSGRVAIANRLVGDNGSTAYQAVPYSSTIIGPKGNWIISQGDGDCSPMSNKARWPIMIPRDADGKPIKNFYRIVNP